MIRLNGLPISNPSFIDAAIDDSGTGQGCGCYLLGLVAAYWSSVRRAKRSPNPSHRHLGATYLATRIQREGEDAH